MQYTAAFGATRSSPLASVPYQTKGYSMYSEVLVQNVLIMLVFRYREQYARRVRTARDFTSIVRLLL